MKVPRDNLQLEQFHELDDTLWFVGHLAKLGKKGSRDTHSTLYTLKVGKTNGKCKKGSKQRSCWFSKIFRITTMIMRAEANCKLNFCCNKNMENRCLARLFKMPQVFFVLCIFELKRSDRVSNLMMSIFLKTLLCYETQICSLHTLLAPATAILKSWA